MGLVPAWLRIIITQLSEAGNPIAGWYNSFQIIRYLPTIFMRIVHTIYCLGYTDFKYNKILKELLTEDTRLKQSKYDLEDTILYIKLILN